MGKGEGHPAFGNLRQDRRFLRLAAGKAQRGSAEHDRRQIRFQREDAAERLHHQHHIDRRRRRTRHSSSANGNPKSPSSAYCDHSARLQPSGSARYASPLVEGVMVGEQPVDRVAQQPLLFGQLEIHYPIL